MQRSDRARRWFQSSWRNEGTHRARFTQLQEHFVDRSVLDIGCASGHQRDDWFHGLIVGVAREVVGVDLDVAAVQRIRAAGYDVLAADAEDLELDRSFDVVHAGELIEHLDDPGTFLDSVHRHVSPDGVLVITTPNPFCFVNFVYRWRAEPKINRDHTCWYCEDTLTHMIRRHGFEVAEVGYLRHRTPGRWRDLASRALRYPLPDRLAWNTLALVARPVHPTAS